MPRWNPPPEWALEQQRRRKELTLALLERDGDECHYCGHPLCLHWFQQYPGLTLATIDHIVPRFHGGSDRWENLVLACRSCNSQKQTMDYDEYRAWRYA
jgi:5-methylcytosine-specific restriction endonuclease McrA